MMKRTEIHWRLIIMIMIEITFQLNLFPQTSKLGKVLSNAEQLYDTDPPINTILFEQEPRL